MLLMTQTLTQTPVFIQSLHMPWKRQVHPVSEQFDFRETMAGQACLHLNVRTCFTSGQFFIYPMFTEFLIRLQNVNFTHLLYGR